MLRNESTKMSERTSKACLCYLIIAVVLLLIPPSFAADKQKDEETLRRANLVLQDMLNSKDISPELLSKADCVLILPDVKKFGFGIGGSGGRGPLLCRGGQKFNGKWSAPAETRAQLLHRCWRRGLKRRPLLQTSSPLIQ